MSPLLSLSPFPFPPSGQIFVVNKWLDLQTARGLNLPFVLFFLVLLLAGAGLEGLATAQPDGTYVDYAAYVDYVGLYQRCLPIIVARGKKLRCVHCLLLLRYYDYDYVAKLLLHHVYPIMTIRMNCFACLLIYLEYFHALHV